jgi:dienelactone hydrolase
MTILVGRSTLWRACVLLTTILLPCTVPDALVRGSDMPPCVPGLGMQAQISVCTLADPCTNLIDTYAAQGITVLDTPESPPTLCRAFYDGKLYSDGAPSIITIPGGPSAPGTPSERHFCQYVPPEGAGAVPLVVYVHGSGGSATGAWRDGWRPFAEAGVPGVLDGPFFLIGTQALNRHWPEGAGLAQGDASKHDFYFRNMTVNDDVRYVDALIDYAVGTGRVNPNRVYLTGYSNGAYFSAMYSIIRSGSPHGGAWADIGSGLTPDGNRVAATAVFSGASPFTRPPECEYTPVPTSPLPVMIVLYACDAVYCDAAAEFADSLEAHGTLNASVIVLADDGSRLSPTECVQTPPNCTQVKRTQNHMNYPHSWIPAMIEFMMRYESSDDNRDQNVTSVAPESPDNVTAIPDAPTPSPSGEGTAPTAPSLSPDGTTPKSPSSPDPTSSRSYFLNAACEHVTMVTIVVGIVLATAVL